MMTVCGRRALPSLQPDCTSSNRYTVWHVTHLLLVLKQAITGVRTSCQLGCATEFLMFKPSCPARQAAS